MGPERKEIYLDKGIEMSGEASARKKSDDKVVSLGYYGSDSAIRGIQEG